jgi:gas vesicle protein
VDAIFTEKYMINQMQEDIPQIVNHLKENKVTKAKFLIEGLETRLGEFVTEVKQLRERYTAQQQRLKEESRRVDNTNKMIQQKRSGNVVIGIGGILLAPVTGKSLNHF